MATASTRRRARPRATRRTHYVFTIYALGEPIDAKPGAPADEVIDKIERAALARGVLTATYER